MRTCVTLLLTGLALSIGCQKSTPMLSQVQPSGPDGPTVDDVLPTLDHPDPILISPEKGFALGTTHPTIIDTREFEKQIARQAPWQGESQSSSAFRPVKEGFPDLEDGPQNNLVPGNVGNQQRGTQQAFFPGITASPWNPPDPALAAGPDHIIQTVNMELAFFSKDGTMEFQQRLDSSGDPGFFEELGSGGFCFDPKCFYDHNSGRYIVLALEVYRDIGESWITFAISDDSDPHGIWYKYRTWSVVDLDGTTYWCDYPGLGFDANGFYVTNNLFRLSGPGPGFGGVLYRAFEMGPLLNGDPAVFRDVYEDRASVQVAQHFGQNAAPFFVSRANSTTMRIQALNDPFGNPTLSTANISVPNGPGPPSADNPGGTLSIVGSRIMNVHWRDGKLWTCHSVESADSTRAVARWYQFETGDWPNSGPNPTLSQSGEIDLGNDRHTFFPAIYSNRYGNAAMVIGQSSLSENPSVQATGRLTVDPAGEMDLPTELIVGGSGANGRWGDYFDIAIDPNDDRTFWVVGEYRESDGWRTTINSFQMETQVFPDSFVVTDGELEDGTIDGLAESDDQYIRVLPRGGMRAEIEVSATSPSESPSQMWFTFEAQPGNTIGQYLRELALFNYDTDNWEIVTDQLTPNGTDASDEFELSGDLSRFVQPGTRKIEARLAIRRKRVSNNLRGRFKGVFDQATWMIAE